MLSNESIKEKINIEEKNTRNKLAEIVKNHKREIIVGTLIIGAAIGTAYMLKGNTQNVNYTKVAKSKPLFSNGEGINLIEQAIPQKLKFGPKEIKSVSVQPHLRELPNGYKPSTDKVATAAKNGFKLTKNQTWVDSYTKLVFLNLMSVGDL